MNKTIKDFSETELKAMAYDCLANIELNQANVKAINDELQARAEAKKAEAPKDDKK
jgi:hypothetical protein